MTQRLFIAAKAPRPGLVKTRLGAQIGHQRAAALYGGFLRDLGLRFAGFPYEVGWFVPAGAWPEILALLGPGWSRSPVVMQSGGDWGERQRRLFAGARGRGEERTVLIASDSPHLERAVVEDAFSRLDRAEVVLGPVLDGGYYLIGIRGCHDVLDGVEMSTPRVTRAIAERCHRLGLGLSLVEPTFDVDEVADLELLMRVVSSRADLSATRAALG